MSHTVHANARTTPRIRAEIRASKLPTNELARKYNTTKDTIRKWRRRDADDLDDRSHTPHNFKTTLSATQEYIVCQLRESLLLPLDDLVFITKEYINEEASRSGIARLLRRKGINRLKDLMPEVEGEKKPVKTFKDYEPGFLHVDVKYLPQMPDEKARRYLFVAIDRASRWVYMEIFDTKSGASSKKFLDNLMEACPVKIKTILTDNGKEFTDRFVKGGERKPTGNHVFDKFCVHHDIDHRLIKPGTPQTNGMVERFNGRVSEVLKQTKYSAGAELERTLKRYRELYNNSIPQKSLGYKSPVDAMKEWYKKKPELFVKRPYKHTEPDN